MSDMEPFNQLVGALEVYIAPVGTAAPAPNVPPGGSWAKMGATDGGQELTHGGKLKFFRDDEHQGPVKARRPEEDVMVAFTLVGLTLENQARVLHAANKVLTPGGTTPTKRMGLKRGANPTEYAMLLRGDALSPYGILPGQYIVPRGVFDGEPKPGFKKDDRTAMDCEFVALEDDTQTNPDDSLGWLEVQIPPA